MAKHRVTVTQEPRVVRTIDDAELVDLDRQGLIYSSESGEYGRHEWRVDDAAETAETPAPITATKTGPSKKGA